MERISLAEAGIDAAAAKAAAALRAGGVVLYPTDTLYGLGADALSDEAVAKVYALKGRRDDKPMHAIVADLAMAERYGEVNDTARRLAERLPKGKATFVVKKRIGLDAGIAKGRATFGFRIPDHDFCVALTRVFGTPVTATSANVSGAAAPRRIDDILIQLGEAVSSISLVIDGGVLPPAAPSTVIDCASGVVILREGVVPAPEVFVAAGI